MKTIKLILAAGLAAILSTTALAQTFGGHASYSGIDREGDLKFIGGSVDVTGRVGGDLGLFAGSIDVDAVVGGNLQAAGGDIDIAGSVARDAEIAGGSVDIRLDIGGDAEFAGGSVEYSGTIQGTLDGAAGIIEFGPETVVMGSADLAGEDVLIQGRFNSNIDVIAERVTIDGVVIGNLDVRAESFTLGPNARISGNIDYEGEREIRMIDGAVMSGQLDYRQRNFESDFDWEGFSDIDLDFDFFPTGEVLIILSAGMAFMIGALAMLIMPRGVNRLSRKFNNSPFMSGLIGFIVFASWPLLLIAGILLLALTIVGAILIPFWVAFLLFIYLLLAFPLGSIAVGTLILQRTLGREPNIGLKLLALLGIVLLSSALWIAGPLGLIAWAILSWIGLGSWSLAAFGAREEAPVATEEAAAV